MSRRSETDNPPGQRSIQYRLGTQATFFERMLADLAREPALADLTARTTEDPSIALLDAWSMVADILSFYQERIANESYVRTATEHRSVVELAGEIGYQLRTGVAASTLLAFTVEEPPESPGSVAIGIGVKVQSIPGQDEQPQTFETVEEVTARPEWNRMTPALPPAVTDTRPPDWEKQEIYLEGAALGLEPGDALLLYGGELREKNAGAPWCVVFADRVTPDLEAGSTTVRWTGGYGDPPAVRAAEELFVAVFRLRAALFGANAPDWRLIPPEIRKQFGGEGQDQWPGYTMPADGVIDLDRIAREVVPGGWVLLVDEATDGKPQHFSRIARVAIAGRVDYSLAQQVTRIEPQDRVPDPAEFNLRTAVVYAQTAPLALQKVPVVPVQPLTGPDVRLEPPVAGLGQGRKVIFSGRRVRVEVRVAELTLEAAFGVRQTVVRGDVLLLLNRPDLGDGRESEWQLQTATGFAGSVRATTADFAYRPAAASDPVVASAAVIAVPPNPPENQAMRLGAALDACFDPATVGILGNVALATHGETVHEVLGGGEGGPVAQRFRLRQPPLTYVSARTPGGRRSTLEVRVDGVLWEEVPALYGQGPRSQVYTVRSDSVGDTWVVFGNGTYGASLPAGRENVQATYRRGIGMAGEVEADTLTLLQTRPLGVQSVTNPLRATGASAPEGLEQAVLLAASQVKALGRIVSLSDYEDFALGFAGIGKARAVAVPAPTGTKVYLTVAAADGYPILPASELYRNLYQALLGYGDPHQPLELQSYRRIELGLEGKIWIDARQQREVVEAAVRQALADAFSFARARLGQELHGDEVLAVMLGVPGVRLAEVERLIPAYPPTAETAAAGPPPAALQVLDPAGIVLEVETW